MNFPRGTTSAVLLSPRRGTAWAVPRSLAGVFKDGGGPHSGAYAHGHHPVGPVGAALCWLGAGTEGRSPAPRPVQTRQSWVDQGLRGQSLQIYGYVVPGCPPRHAQGGRGLLQARVPFTAGPPGKWGSYPCILNAECVQLHFPLLPLGALAWASPMTPPRESASPIPTALQLVEQCDDLSSPSAAQWVAQGHRTPQRVHLLEGQF